MNNLNYGIVGNCRSGALISDHGSVDWLCLPQFDSPSVFAKILDENNGGTFGIEPLTDYTVTQRYLPHTNILVTRFLCLNGSFEVLDFMPRYHIEDQNNHYMPPDLIRYFKWIDGKPEIKINYRPRLEYGQCPTLYQVEKDYIKSYTSGCSHDSLYLYTSFDKARLFNREPLLLESDHYCLVSYHQKLLKQDIEREYLKLQRTKVYWLNWSERTTKYAEYNDTIERSALTLKMLSFQKTGAVLAALTTSLPETIGEMRNWDYRFCWIRDASMVVKIMKHIGHNSISRRYLNFIIDVVPDKDEKIQIMYDINGKKKLTEKILNHFEGYLGSKPVRIGNDAYHQKQNDIYGILLDVLYQHFKIHHTSLEHSEELWTIVRHVARIVKRNWHLPDKGIWELRNENKHFTFSKVLCWTAMDRAIRIATLLKKQDYADNWKKTRTDIQNDIQKKAWSETKQAYTQAYYSEELDASVLLMESYGFINATDSKFVGTVCKIQEELEYKGLLYRYKSNDDFGTPKSAFTICTLWLINSLYKIGKEQEAREKFKELLGYANHLGLFSEDLDFDTKRLLGNFPQAYSHLALIETAITLAEGEKTEEEKIFAIIQ